MAEEDHLSLQLAETFCYFLHEGKCTYKYPLVNKTLLSTVFSSTTFSKAQITVKHVRNGLFCKKKNINSKHNRRYDVGIKKLHVLEWVPSLDSEAMWWVRRTKSSGVWACMVEKITVSERRGCVKKKAKLRIEGQAVRWETEAMCGVYEVVQADTAGNAKLVTYRQQAPIFVREFSRAISNFLVTRHKKNSSAILDFGRHFGFIRMKWHIFHLWAIKHLFINIVSSFLRHYEMHSEKNIPHRVEHLVQLWGPASIWFPQCSIYWYWFRLMRRGLISYKSFKLYAKNLRLLLRTARE